MYVRLPIGMRMTSKLFLYGGQNIMKFKKLICLITAICVVLGLASCGGETKVDMDNSGVVASTNGGFLVETKDYVYFINGVESYSTTYKTGEVVKGALMRAKKSDLSKIGTDGWSADLTETVVSKLLVSGDKEAGVYIYGDYVYYAVPSEEKDTTGTVKSSVLNFFRTKLDGTSTSKKIASEDFSNSAKFRFVQKDGKVFLLVYGNGIYAYNAENGSKLFSYDKTIDEVIFDEDNGGSLYFTIKPINGSLYDPDSEDAQQDKYHELWKYTAGNDKAEKVLSGIGKYTVGEDAETDRIALTGATIDLLKYKGGKLFFSYTSLDTTVAATEYVYLEDGKTAWADAVALNHGDKNAASIFVDNALYLAADKILFIDSTYGLMVYNYAENSLVNADANNDTDFGLKVLYYSEVVAGATISGVIGDYLYVYNAENVYYRLNLTALFNGEETEEFRLNALAMDSSWYKPEVAVANGHELFVGVYTDSVYGSYCYAVDITALKEKFDAADDEGKEELYSTEISSEELKELVGRTLLGKMATSDNENYESYYESLSASEND